MGHIWWVINDESLNMGHIWWVINNEWQSLFHMIWLIPAGWTLSQIPNCQRTGLSTNWNTSLGDHQYLRVFLQFCLQVFLQLRFSGVSKHLWLLYPVFKKIIHSFQQKIRLPSYSEGSITPKNLQIFEKIQKRHFL